MSAERRPTTPTPAHDDHGAGRTAPCRDYVIGFVLSVVLTAIPFWLVMGGALESPGYTAAIVLAFAARADPRAHGLLPAHDAQGRGRLDCCSRRVHHRPRGHHAGRLALDHVPPQHQHDADARRRDDAECNRSSSRRRSDACAAASSRAAAVLLASPAFVALGVWQLERRAWKLDLIARVDARLAAAPVAAPGAGRLAGARRRDDEYARRAPSPAASSTTREVAGPRRHRPRLRLLGPDAARDPGLHRAGQPRLRAAATAATRRRAATASRRARPVTGLLRLTEPGGGFLRAQRPRRRPLVLARRRRHRRRPSASRTRWRPTSSTPTRRPNPGGLPGRRADRRPLPQRPPQLRADLVRPRRGPRASRRQGRAPPSLGLTRRVFFAPNEPAVPLLRQTFQRCTSRNRETGAPTWRTHPPKARTASSAPTGPTPSTRWAATTWSRRRAATTSSSAAAATMPSTATGATTSWSATPATTGCTAAPATTG